MENSYLRVGTTYYKIVYRPTISGEKSRVLLRWDKSTISYDEGKDYLSTIPKYEGFCCIPDHINYKQVINGFYNEYSPISHSISSAEYSADEIEKKIPNSLHFIKHIFGEQYELGLDYIKLLYEKPTQMLPILCLVSEERSTGKSTFIKWLKKIFEDNLTYVKGDSFGSQFNADWANKLLIAVDEVFFAKKEITERLKFLSTTNKDKLEAKGKDRIEVDFFAKFILCSNNETDFIKIDNNEIRFWVRKIPPIKTENTEFLKSLQSEVPLFLQYLFNRKYHTSKSSRMWFKPTLLRTNALKRLMFQNNNELERKMIESFYELFESVPEKKSIEFVPQDILNTIQRLFNDRDWTRNDVRKILKNNWGLQPQSQTLTYSKVYLNIDGDYCVTNNTGRYYSISKNTISQKFDEFDEFDERHIQSADNQ